MINSEESIENKAEQLDERSVEVKEVLGKSPSWVIRWGNSVVFIIIGIIILSSALVSYNDVIPATIVVTSKNPPLYLKAKSEGRLSHIFVEAGQRVVKGDILAMIENTATIDDMLYLRSQIVNFSAHIENLDSLQLKYPPYLNLGTVQVAYGEFRTHYQNFILFNSLTPSQKESNLLRRQLEEQKVLYEKQKRQLETYRQSLELSQNSYDRNTLLFDKGVISKAEYENATQDFLNNKRQYEGFRTSMSNTQIAIENYNNLLTKSDIAGTEFRNNYKQQLNNAYQRLKNDLLFWEQQFLIMSPISGKVTLFDVWNQFQNVNEGEILFTVVPNDLEEIIGKVALPIRNSGKVKKGQKVLIKLDNYPFEEWGSLQGEIDNISEVPKQGEKAYYTLYISIDNLTTTYDKEIDFKQEMQGTAEIIVEELTILQRIFYQLRKVLDIN